MRKKSLDSPTLDLELEMTDGLSVDFQDRVEDEAANEPIDNVTYDFRSYGVDVTVHSLVSRLEKEAFFVPPFPRSFVWTKPQASRFIESLLLGFPVPGIFVATERESDRYIVIDGRQRLKTLQFFFRGKFRGRIFNLERIDRRWNGKTIEELEREDRLRLEESIIHTTVFKQDSPDDYESIYLVFERLNTGGSLLRPQEIRSCVSYGKFIELLGTMNEDPNWRAIYGPVSKRQKDQELILRFLAFLHHGKYYLPMRDFLNEFTRSYRHVSDRRADEFQRDFAETMATVRESLGDRPFRTKRYLNAAVFDAVTVAIAKRLKQGPVTDRRQVRRIYGRLLDDGKFQHAYSYGTAGLESVRSRFQLAENAFGELV